MENGGWGTSRELLASRAARPPCHHEERSVPSGANPVRSPKDPQVQKHNDASDAIRHGWKVTTSNLKHVGHEERLRDLALFDEEINPGETNDHHHEAGGSKPFPAVPADATRSTGHKQQLGWLTLGIRKTFSRAEQSKSSSQRNCPGGCVISSPKVFKTLLNKTAAGDSAGLNWTR